MQIIVVKFTQITSQLNNLFHYFHVGVFQYYHQLADSTDNVMKEDGNAAISLQTLWSSSLLFWFYSSSILIISEDDVMEEDVVVFMY